MPYLFNDYEVFSFNKTKNEHTSRSAELDSETGLYYYGARYYDPRTSIWLNVDPLAEKTGEVYIYVRNNPIKYIDPTGMFKIPIHKRITNNALLIPRYKNRNQMFVFSKAFRSDLQLGVQGADYIGFAMDFHFDGRQNYQEVTETWSKLYKDIQSTTAKIGFFNKRLGVADVVELGRLLHNLQDFYAHSNYVDLYVDYYKSNNNGEMPTSVPIYDITNGGTTDPKFKEILEKNLRTGDFHLLDNEAIDIDPFHERANSPTSHNKMNKDKADTPIGKLAEKVATEHTQKIIEKIE